MEGKSAEYVDPLRLYNVNATKKYLQLLSRYFQEHKIREKVEKITIELHQTQLIENSHEKEKAIEDQAKELNKVDELCIQLMLAAERKCQRKPITTTYAWSKPLMKAGQLVTMWKARKKAAAAKIHVREISGYAVELHRRFQIPIVEMNHNQIKQKLKEG